MALPIEECVSFQRHAYTAMSYLATYPSSDFPPNTYIQSIRKGKVALSLTGESGELARGRENPQKIS